MTPRIDSSGSAVTRAALAVLFLTAFSGPVSYAQPASCPQNAPILGGPSLIRPGQTYTLSWPDVFVTKPNDQEHYWVERAVVQDFSGTVERFSTSRSAIVLSPPPQDAKVVYHRITVASACPGPGGIPLLSSTLAIAVGTECVAPPAINPLAVWPEKPMAYTTYVVAWSPLNCGPMSFGRCSENIRYRIRRVGLGISRDWVSSNSTASFTDPPGEYVYQVRAEDICGAGGAWTPQLKVVVGGVTASVAVVSEPKPLFSTLKGDATSTAISVRNTGTETLVLAAMADGPFEVSPPFTTLSRGEIRSLSVRLSANAPAAPAHGRILLITGNSQLEVPVSGMVAPAAADAVVWSGDQVVFDSNVDSAVRTLQNPSSSTAAVLGSVSMPWILVEAVDGGVWDRPLAPAERRDVRIRINRALRRAEMGTETGSVGIYSAGFAEPSVLRVIDDGPEIPLSNPVRPAAEESRTRILFASTANAKDLAGAGLFSTELWISNVDSNSPVDVTLFFTPIEASGAGATPRRADLILGPGETRRFRNVVDKIARVSGACALEVSSPAPTVTATAIVTNTPLAYVEPSKRSRGTLASVAGGVPQYGFEMRPVSPGEGVSATSAPFVLSGLRHDSRRRTNVLLTETAGSDATVKIELFDENGFPVARNGQPVSVVRTVPALSTLQLNDEADLFGPDTLSGSPYAVLTFQSGTPDPTTGQTLGAVMPIATVIDRGTQDASLRIGVSQTALNPLPPAANTAAGLKTVQAPNSLPFGGGAAPLMFPVVHSIGAPLLSGEKPLWKTRVTLTNINENEQRRFRMKFLDQNGIERKSPLVIMGRKTSITFEDTLEELFPGDINPEDKVYGPISIEPVKNSDGSTWLETWADVDVQTETYTPDPSNPGLGDFKTGMEGYSYRHGYSSFQSNMGTVQIDGAENSSGYRTNLILQEIGGSYCQVAVSVYRPGSFVPITTKAVDLAPFGYISRELFRGYMGLDLSEIVDARVVVKQIDGDGVFIAFASKINLATGDPANVFLRPAAAGTGR